MVRYPVLLAGGAVVAGVVVWVGRWGALGGACLWGVETYTACLGVKTTVLPD